MTDRKVWQCDCVPGSIAVRVCHGDRPECWGNGNGEEPDWLAEHDRALRVATLNEAADALERLDRPGRLDLDWLDGVCDSIDALRAAVLESTEGQ